MNEVPFADVAQASFPDKRVRDAYLSAIWSAEVSPNHELQLALNHSGHHIRQRWATCPPTATMLAEMFELWRVDPSYASTILRGRIPSGGSPQADALAAAALAAIARVGPRAAQPTCVTGNQDLTESRTDVELQDTYVFSDSLRVVSGLGAREQRARSQTFFGGSVSSRLYRLFANAEYKPRPWMTLNLGAYGEHESNTGWSWSPRAGFNARLSRNHAVRFVVSKGTRTPDLFEQHADWIYTLTGMTPPLDGQTSSRFYQSARSPGGLRPEKIVSRELGYMFIDPRLGVNLDVKLFDDRLTSLLSEKLEVANFLPSNGNSVRLTGVELQAGAELAPGWAAFVNYAYLDNHRGTTELERTQYSRHSGSAGFSHSTTAGLQWSLAYYGASGDGLGQSAYGRTDFTLGKSFSARGMRCRAALTLSRLNNGTTTYFRDFGSTLRSSYDNRTRIHGHLEISL